MHSDLRINSLAFVYDVTGTGLRQIQGASNVICGRDDTPDHTTLCRLFNRLGRNAQRGLAVICDYGRTLILTVDSAGMSMSKTNGWRQEKHGRKRGFLSHHTVADEKTGEVVASKTTAPEDGDSPQFEDLFEGNSSRPYEA